MNYIKLDGHVENVPSNGKIIQWKKINNLFHFKDDNKIKKCLMDLDWSLKDQELLLKVRKDYNRKVGRYYIKEECFPSYKQLFWDEGIIHHEDVLYFSFNLLEQYPMIKEFLSAKYPYIFLDEFQDTNPIQTQIIKWLGEAGSLTGVIGDPAQSIYKFQGASRKDFLELNLLNQKNYKIEKNRRSTENIIKILNHLRNGDNINQSCYRANLGNDVLYIVSNDTNYIINKFKEVRKAIGCYKDYCIITRKNDDVIKLKNGDKSCDCKLWDKVFECDFSRGRFLKNLFTAQELAVEDRYEMAIKEVLKLFKSNRDGKLREPFKSTIEITNLQKEVMQLVY
ncbi:ATP-dependent helicase [Clostridium botulinum]|nr:ATP-dependent helicase [Clostridium botulinum]